MEAKRIVVIGGSAAGAKAAAKARRLDQKAEITIIQQDPDLSMASCGYPYYVGGVFDNRNALLSTPTGVVRGPEFFQKTKAITALPETKAVEIDRVNKRVHYTGVKTGDSSVVEYDKLVYCTGASAKVPPVAGKDLHGVTTLVSMEDTDFLHQVVAEKKASHVVVIGGGLIGVEVCEALVGSSIKVTLVEMSPDILIFLDPQMSKLAANHMKSKGVNILTEMALECFVGESGQLTGVMLRDGSVLDCEVAVVATGVQPNTKLAADAGLEIGKLGGVVVDEFMVTSDPDIYAAGDCVEVKNMVTGQQSLAPMGDLANLQGRVAGENLVLGNSISFPGTIHTAICKIFDFTAGATGVSEETARKAGIDAIETVVNASPDKLGFMGAKLLISKIVIDVKANKIIGYQCVGNGDVSRQLATAAMAIQGGMSLDQLCCADLPYAPPYSLAIDHFIASAHIVQNKIKGRFKTISAEEVMGQVSRGDDVFYLDGRGLDEYEVLRLGIGEHYLPLGALKGRLDELPVDKDSEIVCFCKISLRGYEASIVLEDLGYTNVRVMEGGIVAWPYKREK